MNTKKAFIAGLSLMVMVDTVEGVFLLSAVGSAVVSAAVGIASASSYLMSTETFKAYTHIAEHEAQHHAIHAAFCVTNCVFESRATAEECLRSCLHL